MNKIIHEEGKVLNEMNDHEVFVQKQLNSFLQAMNYKIYIFVILLFINDIVILTEFSNKTGKFLNKDKKINIENRAYNNTQNITYSKHSKSRFIKESERPYMEEINKKRTFENRFPLSKEINCKPHFTEVELIAFLSFLTKNTTYFETGSGCSSLIAKYYAKKSFAVEGCKEWYDQGVKNGLKENLIFHDLKPDNPIWSFPGKNSNLNDWKKYFQSYDRSYNADVILIDGRFKIATAMDIFDKIRDDTIVFIHEYQDRPSYFILENYYNYVYHWGTLTAFVKRKNIKSIPLEIQKKYWNKFL